MKIKTSITLSNQVLKLIDNSIDKDENRSLFIERAVWEYIDKRKREIRNQKDLRIINDKARQLNKEAKDVLSYQVDI